MGRGDKHSVTMLEVEKSGYVLTALVVAALDRGA
jgi:hypothetical protein